MLIDSVPAFSVLGRASLANLSYENSMTNVHLLTDMLDKILGGSVVFSCYLQDQ